MQLTASQHQVFSLHDPRLGQGQSCVFVGVTQRDDIELCAKSIVHQRFKELAAECKRAGLAIGLVLHGGKREKTLALDHRFDVCQKYKKSGSSLDTTRNSKPKPRLFTITVEADDVIDVA